MSFSSFLQRQKKNKPALRKDWYFTNGVQMSSFHRLWVLACKTGEGEAVPPIPPHGGASLAFTHHIPSHPSSSPIITHRSATSTSIHTRWIHLPLHSRWKAAIAQGNWDKRAHRSAGWSRQSLPPFSQSLSEERSWCTAFENHTRMSWELYRTWVLLNWWRRKALGQTCKGNSERGPCIVYRSSGWV